MAYNDLLKIRTWSLDGAKTEHVTEKVQAKTWSGSYKDCARQLSFSVLPEALAELGGMARLYKDADILFSGHIVSRNRDSLGKTVDCSALDNGLYLKRNSTYMAVRKQTPEAVTAQLCGEFGVPCGELAATGVPLSRNFLGVSLYQIIQTMYTLAAEQTGKQYQIRFRSNHLTVVEKAVGPESIRLVPGSNLLSCRSAESIERMVNRVAVYDDDKFKKVAQPATAAAVSACAAHIEEERPIGPSVTVEAAKTLEVTVEAAVTLESGAGASTVRAALEEAVTEYLRATAASAFGGSVDLQFEAMDAGAYSLLFNRVAFLLLSIPGVVDYTALSLNGGTENLSIPADTLPVLKEVVVR